MTRTSLLAGGAVLAVALTPGVAPAKPKPKPSKYCVPKTVGFEASGTFVSGSISQTAGADTAKKGDDRYSGSIVVDVKKANHGAAKGEQTYTLADARVAFHPGKHTTPAAGDRVKVSGRFTTVTGKKCTNTGVTSQTVRRADIKAAKKS